MPITQDRLIRLVAHADVLIQIIDEQKELARELDYANAVSSANRVIEATNDVAARDAILKLLNMLERFYRQCVELEVPALLRDNITEERTNFKFRRNSNERLAAYKRWKRQAELNVVNSITKPTVEPKRAPIAQDFEGTEEYKRFEKEMQRKREREAQKTFPKSFLGIPTSREKFALAPPELNVPLVAETATKSELTENAKGYDKGVLRTSVPSLDELNEVGTTKPTESVL